jgi:hypothetical protein
MGSQGTSQHFPISQDQTHLDVLLLLQLEDVAVELLLQLLVGIIDAELIQVLI